MFHVIYLDPGNEGERAAFDQHEPWATTRKGIIQHRRFNTGSDGGDLCWYRPFLAWFFVCCFPHSASSASRASRKKSTARLCTDPAHFASADGALRCSKCAVPSIHTIPFTASTVRAPFLFPLSLLRRR